LRGSQPIFKFSKIEKSHIIFLLNLISTSESLCHWPKYIKSLITSLIPIPFTEVGLISEFLWDLVKLIKSYFLAMKIIFK
jgi:hypothetical protein